MIPSGGVSVRSGALSPGPRDTTLRIVALLERSGGRASKPMLAASLHLSPRAIDDAVRKLESEGVVSASRMPQADDATVRLYRPRTRNSE